MKIRDLILYHDDDGVQFFVYVNNKFVNIFTKSKLPDNEAMELNVKSYKSRCGKVLIKVEV